MSQSKLQPGQASVGTSSKPDSLWRNRSFNLLWISETLSDLGTSFAVIATPLLVLMLTDSAILAGLIGTITSMIRLFVRLPAGIIVDVLPRKRLMLVCDALAVVAYFLFGILIVTGNVQVVHVIIVGVIAAVCSAFFSTAEQAALPNLVQVKQQAEAVARNESRNYAASLAGPPLGGLFFSLGAAVPFFANAVTFFISFWGVLFIRDPMQAPAKPTQIESAEDDVEAAERRKGGGYLDGVKFVLANPFLRSVLFICAPLNLAFNGILLTLIFVFKREDFSEFLIGTSLTVFSLGGLFGSMVAPWLMRKLQLSKLVIMISWAATVLMLVCALLAPSYFSVVPVSLAAFLGPAVTSALFGYQAAITPDHIRGKVTSFVMFVVMSLSAFAPILAGWITDTWSGEAAIFVFAIVVGVAAVYALLSKGVRQMRPLSEIAAEEAEKEEA